MEGPITDVDAKECMTIRGREQPGDNIERCGVGYEKVIDIP